MARAECEHLVRADPKNQGAVGNTSNPSSGRLRQEDSDLKLGLSCLVKFHLKKKKTKEKAKNPSSHVLSPLCFSRVSFLLCMLQLKVPL